MGNMEGCLRAAGLAAAEEAKRGDILPPIGSSTNQTNQSSALGGSEEEVLPEELPLPVALEDALAESATDESVTQPKLTTESEPTEPEPTEPEHREPEAEAEPVEPEPTNSEPVSVEEIAVVEESDANVEPSIDGFLDDRASQNLIEQANAEFDRLDTNGDGTLSPEEFAASSALAGAELVTEVADSDEESAADAEVPEYRREWTERLQAAESEAAAEQADDEEASIGQANEAMHAWQEGDEAGMSEPQPEPEVAVADGEEPVDGLHKFLDAVKAGFGSQYTSALKEGGFETGRALSLASAKDLQQCGVALGHALLIVDTVQKVAKYC